LPGGTLKIFRTRLKSTNGAPPAAPAIRVHDDACIAVCADGSTLHLLDMEFEGRPLNARDFLSRFGDNPVILETRQQ
jgi:hypothetical protein